MRPSSDGNVRHTRLRGQHAFGQRLFEGATVDQLPGVEPAAVVCSRAPQEGSIDQLAQDGAPMEGSS